VDHESDPDGQEAGRMVVETFCSKTGINLAGFDLLYPDALGTQDEDNGARPFFLEINYYFGRRGLGGSDRYYELVDMAVAQWAKSLGLSFSPA
jgi:ribosomal protein S6--L-glutamate ligase